MERQQITTFIRTVPIFVELGDDQLEQLAAAVEERAFSEGEVIAQPGREASSGTFKRAVFADEPRGE